MTENDPKGTRIEKEIAASRPQMQPLPNVEAAQKIARPQQGLAGNGGGIAGALTGLLSQAAEGAKDPAAQLAVMALSGSQQAVARLGKELDELRKDRDFWRQRALDFEKA